MSQQTDGPCEEVLMECEECKEQVCDDDYVGCCRDGECPRRVENLCRACGTWDEETGVWKCKECAKPKTIRKRKVRVLLSKLLG